MTQTQQLKTPIRAFLTRFPDDRLAALLAHAQDGKLAFWSCSCLIGSINAPHALTGAFVFCDENHENEARKIEGGVEAEAASYNIGRSGLYFGGDPLRRRILIPMIRAEFRRRSRLSEPAREEMMASFAR